MTASSFYPVDCTLAMARYAAGGIQPADLRIDAAAQGDVLAFGLRHRILPLLAEAIVRLSANIEADFDFLDFLSREIALTKERHAIQLAHAAEITEALTKDGIPHVFSKGLVLQQRVYGPDWPRRYNDLDLIVPQDAAEKVIASFSRLGYRKNVYWDPVAGALSPMPRRSIVMVSIAPDHIPYFSRATGKTAAPRVMADISHTISWMGCDHQLDIQAFLDISTELPAEGLELIPSLSGVWLFLDVLFQAYKECQVERLARRGTRLKSFIDLGLMTAQDPGLVKSAEMIDAVARFDVTEPVSWVLHHLDALLATNLQESFAAAWAAAHGPLTEPDYDTYQRTRGGVGRWHGTMIDRMLCRDPGRHCDVVLD